MATASVIKFQNCHSWQWETWMCILWTSPEMKSLLSKIHLLCNLYLVNFEALLFSFDRQLENKCHSLEWVCKWYSVSVYVRKCVFASESSETLGILEGHRLRGCTFNKRISRVIRLRTSVWSRGAGPSPRAHPYVRLSREIHCRNYGERFNNSD